MVTDKTISKIEDIFGFKLYQWQKDYIQMKTDYIPQGGRGNGKTFAFVLRQLLNYDVKVPFIRKYPDFYLTSGFVCDRNNIRYQQEWFICYVYDIAKRLIANDIDTIFG